MVIKRVLFPILLGLGVAFAASVAPRALVANPYASERERPVKALSPEETSDLAAGRGGGLAKVAELNHYPGPKHVLDLKQELKLTEPQLREIERIHAAMDQEARGLGERIVARETELEARFAGRRADEASARPLFVEIGQLRGELRFAHVKAHLATARVLSAEQIALYDQLRGYKDKDKDSARHDHHH